MRLSSHMFGALMLALALPVFAAQTAAFDTNRFALAQGEGRPILIDITASWCPVCAAQKPIIARLANMPEFRNFVILQVDFDTQKAVVHRFHAISQSTLIAFRGRRETSRSVGDTSAASIEQLLRSASR